ncbi:MAG: hypothetical protein ACE5DR_02050, partial [Thermodesulfobacteriota bacterium]
METASVDVEIPGKTVFLETFGCQMNESDSERLLGFLTAIGYRRVP